MGLAPQRASSCRWCWCTSWCVVYTTFWQASQAACRTQMGRGFLFRI